MGKFKPKTFGATILGISLVIFIILISLDADGAVGANIPAPPLQIVTVNDNVLGEFEAIQNPDGTITTAIGDIELPNVACWIKQEVSIFSLTDDQAIATLKSPFFRSQPFISVPLGSITDTETGRNIADAIYVTIPQIKCVSGEIDTSLIGSAFAPIGEIDPDDPTLFDVFNYPSVATPLTVQDSFFKIFVFAELPNGTWKEVFNTHYTVERFDITSPSAINLDSFTIRQEWIDPYLPDGDYNSKYRIVYDGAFLMNWKQTSSCDADCASIPFVIPVVTSKTFNQSGQISSLFNEFQVTRDVTVGKPEDNGVQTITCDEFTEELDPETQTCIMIDPNEQPCPQGQVRSGTECITIGADPNDPTDVSIPFEDIINKIQTCLDSGSPACLASPELLPLWIFGVGIVVLLGALAQRRQPEIYGVPT